ncbi:tetratricopeptide repeat protein [Psychroflexus planctonicus]|uniref:HTH luxR-type domain-containing protein n=1 Tax=Psychroflexus planctonicus TaxID=1526575 RepID=A0ABQ1SLG6_9FLAO|nr:hypothetical protein [Psychroflexus planctonicus]GGE45186.1 hypothetical protein GCM10010832_26390 [Psychroflexus planctonicus]
MSLFMVNIYKGILCGTACIFLVSCSDKNKELQTNFQSSQAFNQSKISKSFEQIKKDEQLTFLIHLIQTTYSNPKDEKEWLAKNLHTILQDNTKLNSSNLTELNHLLLKKDCVNEAVPYATKLLAKNTRVSKATKSSAASILSAYYNSTKQADSLGKYVDILESNIQEKDDDLWQYMSLYSNKGNLANLKGKFFNAAVNYQKAIDYAKPSDTKNLSVLYHNLASMYLNLDYIDKANYYTDLTLEFINPENIPLYYYNTQGIIQGKAKNFKEAEETFQTIIEKSKQGSHQMLLAQSYSNYGNLKRKKKEFEAGLKYLSLSDSICKKLNVEIGILYNKLNRAELYYDSKKYDKALLEITPLKDVVVETDNPKLKMAVYETLYRIYDVLSHTDLANTYFRNYIENKNKYIGDLPKSVISEWELAREREQKLQLRLAYENELQKQIAKKYGLSIGLFLLILVSVITYFIIAKKQQLYQQEKKDLEYQLQIKSKELLSNSIKDLGIQQTKDWLRDQLNLILDDLPSVHKKKFSLLKQELKSTTTQELLADFETKFQTSYYDFYKRLKSMGPDLSPNELILCALIKINYSSKDIALLTNRSLRTIENSRSLIRKKLQLSPNENLQNFIMSI